jgi:hypothetical protein
MPRLAQAKKSMMITNFLTNPSKFSFFDSIPSKILMNLIEEMKIEMNL